MHKKCLKIQPALHFLSFYAKMHETSGDGKRCVIESISYRHVIIQVLSSSLKNIDIIERERERELK